MEFMGLIDRIRIRRERASVGPGSRPESHTGLVSHQRLSFKQGSNEWGYDDDSGQIYLNGDDVEDRIDFKLRRVSDWSAVSSGLTDYKEFVHKNSPDIYLSFVRRADALQDRILYQMKRVYDEKMGGIYLKWVDGVPFLSKMNIRAIMVMFQLRPTLKAKRYLEGVRGRLYLFLKNQPSHSRLDNLTTLVNDLIHDVDALIENTTVNYPRLPSSQCDSSS
jgi:hypothetical protein